MTSPRPRRHGHSNASVSLDEAGRAAPVAGPSSNAMGSHINPLTLDPDEAFVQMGVRQVQDVEAELRSSLEILTARLRMLVSERYRDMLGTANTLIDLGGSSSQLVKRLEAVSRGIAAASIPADQSDNGTNDQLREAPSSASSTDQEIGNESAHVLGALVAVTKLIVEAPDEISQSLAETRRLECSIKAPSSASAEIANGSGRSGRESRDLAAAHILRSAWIFAVAMRAQQWLHTKIEETMEINSTSAQSQEIALFPYVTRQAEILNRLKHDIIDAARRGLKGWAAGDVRAESQWRDFSTSYTATLTSLLSLALLSSDSTTESLFDTLLQIRTETLRDRLSDGSSSRQCMQAPAFVLHFAHDTLQQSLGAFTASGLDNDSKESAKRPSLVALWNSLKDCSSKSGKESASLLPRAMDALETMPSRDLFLKFLPSFTIQTSRTLNTASLSGILSRLSQWSSNIRQEDLTQSVHTLVEQLRSIDAVGKAQITVWNVADRSARLLRTWQTLDVEAKSLIEQHNSSIAAHLDTLLAGRLVAIFKERGAQLSYAIAQDIRKCLQSLQRRHRSSFQRGNMISPTNDVLSFGPQDVLHDSTQPQGSEVSAIVQLIRGGMHGLSQDVRHYIEMVNNRTARRQTTKSLQAASGTSTLSNSPPSTFTSPNDVQSHFESSFFEIQRSFVQELSSASDEILRQIGSTQESDDASAALLFLAQIASALRNATTLQKAASHSLANLSQHLYREWASLIVNKAIQDYDSISPEVLPSTSKESSSPSTGLIYGLRRLVHGYHISGCRFHTQTLWLRKELVEGFSRAWLARRTTEKGANSPELQVYIDAEILLALLEPGSELQPAADARASGEVLSALEQVKQGSNMASNCSELAAVALARLRLIIVSLALSELQFLRRASSGITTGYSTGLPSSSQAVKSNAGSSASAPHSFAGFRPLPSLHATHTSRTTQMTNS